MFAVTFPVGSLAPAGVPLLPVQLWEAGFDFLLALLLYFLTNRSPFPYLGLAVYGICYSVFRFTVEFFRGDLIRGFWFSLSTSQWISLLVFVLCLADVFYQLKKHKYRS